MTDRDREPGSTAAGGATGPAGPETDRAGDEAEPAGDETGPADLETIAAVFDTARRLDAAGAYADAEAAFRVVLGATADADDGNAAANDTRLLRARALIGLAALCRYDGRLEDARRFTDESRDLARAVDDAAIVSEVAAETALVDLERGDPAAAGRNAELAVVNAMAIPDPRARDAATALALQARAAVGRHVGDYKAAEGDLLEAQRRAKRGFGPESLELASVLSDLGVVRKFSGDFVGSGIAHRRALGIIVRVGGPDHPDLATVEHNLGGLEFSRGNLAAAVDHGRRSVRRHERSLGDDHVVTALDRVALAAILDRSGAGEEARALLLDALPVLEERLGTDHREVAVAYNNLAAIAQRDGDYEAAERWYRRSLEIKERVVGSDAPTLATTLVNLAGVRRAQGRPVEAAALLRRAIAILEPAVTPTHPTLAVARRHLARVDAASADP